MPPDQCLGGTLISIQQSSIVMKFNQRVTTMRLTPEAEIWRRGVDLNTIGLLVPGEQIYLKCVRDGNGGVVASIVAAVEKDDAVDLEPHHIREIRVCGGILVRATQNTVSARNDDGVWVARLYPGATIWRGETLHDTTALKPGDEVMARVVVNYSTGELLADEVVANIAKAEGTVVSIQANRFVVRSDRRERFTVFFDRRTSFEGELKKGATVMAIGLDLGHNTFRATSVVAEN